MDAVNYFDDDQYLTLAEHIDRIVQKAASRCYLVIRFEDRRHPNIGFTLLRVLAVFTRSAITPPKVIHSFIHIRIKTS